MEFLKHLFHIASDWVGKFDGFFPCHRFSIFYILCFFFIINYVFIFVSVGEFIKLQSLLSQWPLFMDTYKNKTLVM